MWSAIRTQGSGLVAQTWWNSLNLRMRVLDARVVQAELMVEWFVNEFEDNIARYQKHQPKIVASICLLPEPPGCVVESPIGFHWGGSRPATLSSHCLSLHTVGLAGRMPCQKCMHSPSGMLEQMMSTRMDVPMQRRKMAARTSCACSSRALKAVGTKDPCLWPVRRDSRSSLLLSVELSP